MEMLTYVREALTTKFATFSGRARRREYWLFCLFMVIVSVAIQALSWAVKSSAVLTIVVSIISIVWSLYTFIPTIAIAVRRLHDTNHSGWWYPFGAIMSIAFAILLTLAIASAPNNTAYLVASLVCLAVCIAYVVLFFLPGTKGENNYGPDPKAKPEENDIIKF